MPDANTAFIDPFFQESTLVLSCDVLEPGDGKSYEVDAPDIHAATSALGYATVPEDKYHAAARQDLDQQRALGLSNIPERGGVAEVRNSVYNLRWGVAAELLAAS